MGIGGCCGSIIGLSLRFCLVVYLGVVLVHYCGYRAIVKIY